MTSIVIPISTDSRWSDGELRHCLRSIEMHLTGVGDIFLIGNPRKWLQNVISIPADDVPMKQLSIFNKLLLACYDDRVSDPFLMMNDDHFCLQPVVVSQIPYYYQGDLKRMAVKAQGIYQRVVCHTMKWLNDNAHTIKYYDVHTPMLIHKEKFLNLLEADWKRDYCIKSLYGNINRVKGVETADLNFSSPLRRNEIAMALAAPILTIVKGERVTTERVWFSCNDGGLNDGVKELLGRLYPDKSKYEI